MAKELEVEKLTDIINLIFNENKFNSFKKYCFKQDIYLIEELNNDFVNNYSRIDGIGNKRVDNVKVKLAEAAVLKNSIDTIFSSRKYKLFRDYCQKNNIKEIEDLNLVFIQNFSNKKGIGESKIKDLYLKLFQIMLIELKIKEADEFLKYLKVILKQTDFKEFNKIYNDYNPIKADEISEKEFEFENKIIREITDGFLTKFNSSNTNLFSLKPEIRELTKEIKLSFLLKLFDIKLEKEFSNEIVIKDIISSNINEINKLNIEIEDLILLFNQLNKLKNPLDLFEDLKLKPRSKEIFNLRYGKEKTLKEIAVNYDLTRERVRQILKFKIEDYFSSADIQNKVIRYFKIISKNNNLIKAEKAADVLGENSNSYLSFFQDNISNFHYFKPFDVYYFSTKNINDDIDKIITSLPDFFNIYNYLDNILSCMENIKNNPNLDDVEIMLDYFGYSLDQSKEFAVRRDITKRKVLEILFYNYISEPLRINEDNFNYIINLAKEKLKNDFDFPSIRAMRAVLRNSDKIILVDHLTFLHLEKLDIDISVIFKINSFLSSKKEHRNVININEIISEFEEDLKEAGINNKILLYSLIKINLNEYSYGNTNSFNIYLSKDFEEYEREEMLISVLNQNNGIVAKDKVLKILKHWQISKLNDVVNRSDKILNWSDKIIFSDNLEVIYKDELYSLVSKKLEDGYISTPQLLKELKRNPKLNRILEINNINDNIRLSSYLKYIFQDLYGYNNLLFEGQMENKSLKELVVNFFPNKANRKELYNFFEKLDFKNPHATLSYLIEQEVYIEISRSELINSKKIIINDKIKNKVVNYITFKITNKPYLVLNNLTDYQEILPVTKYEWTPHLIKYCLQGSKYKEIDKENSDYRFDNIIIVNKENKINNLKDLVKFILIKEFNGFSKRKKLLKKLFKENILTKNKSKYTNHLPKEVLDSDIFLVDEKEISVFNY
ncbi:MAG: sigma factor-like helix-turn-helix DNA-binding protein [Bacillota bacterium]